MRYSDGKYHDGACSIDHNEGLMYNTVSGWRQSRAEIKSHVRAVTVNCSLPATQIEGVRTTRLRASNQRRRAQVSGRKKHVVPFRSHAVDPERGAISCWVFFFFFYLSGIFSHQTQGCFKSKISFLCGQGVPNSESGEFLGRIDYSVSPSSSARSVNRDWKLYETDCPPLYTIRAERNRFGLF